MILTLALPVSVRAQYYSINVDYQTMAAMSEAYTTENAMEMLHNEICRRSMIVTRQQR